MTLAKFCYYHQGYQSLATAAQVHSTSILGKSNRSLFGSNGGQLWANLRILGCPRKKSWDYGSLSAAGTGNLFPRFPTAR
jgi:hypothetical protein